MPEALGKSNLSGSVYIDMFREKHEDDMDWMTVEFDTATTYKVDGAMLHWRYGNLCCHFI
jgi:hypothetical protein